MAADATGAFFSYCRADSEFALRLAEDLKAAGANVWMDMLDIEPGTPWDRVVQEALKLCPRVLVILSPVSVDSENVLDEVSFALSKQKRVIPVLYRECDVPLRLARLQYVDFRSDYAHALKALLKALGVEQALAPTTPAQPQNRKRIQTLNAPQPATQKRPQDQDRTPSKQQAAKSHRKRTSEAVHKPVASGKKQTPARVTDTPPLTVWEVETPRDLHKLRLHKEYVGDVAVSADGTIAASASGNGEVKIWSVDGGSEFLLEKNSHPLFAVAMTEDGRCVISGSLDGAIKAWDVHSRQQLYTLSGHATGVLALRLSSDGRRLVSASFDKTLKVWDLGNGREVRTLQGHSDAVWGLALTRDGRTAVSASSDKSLKVWDVESGRLLHTLAGHSDGVTGVAVDADGRIAVSASRDNTLKVWQLDSGREVGTLRGHSDIVLAVAVSADGKFAGSASWDKTLKTWELESGSTLATLKFGARPRCLAVSSDQKTIVVGDNGGSVHYQRLA